jgi:hypothetical protein
MTICPLHGEPVNEGGRSDQPALSESYFSSVHRLLLILEAESGSGFTALYDGLAGVVVTVKC